MITNEFDSLSVGWDDDNLTWHEEGCGCCSSSGAVPDGQELEYIDAYLAELRDKIALWEVQRAKYAN